MKEVIYKKGLQKVPIKSWVIDLEYGALEQAKNISNLPFVFRHVALMPDCHQGFGMPIGGVMATKNVVVPNAVGVDIGCGMCAVKTNIKVEDFNTETLKEIMGEIRKVIPVGFKHRQEMCDESEMPDYMGEPNSIIPICNQEYSSARKQLGTLGGGNHFIEIQKGDDGFIWIMIHSGSRNVGLKVAKYYNDIAKELNKKWYSSVDVKEDLAFLPLDTKEVDSYMEEMGLCLEFAYANRLKMMNDVCMCFEKFVDKVEFEPMINIHHNYVTMENHFGENVMVHRKGATSARKGEVGIIPGSQGTCSYIVEGLGNVESYESCSHGAGRKMGRKDAQRRLNFKEEKKKLEEKGILHSIRNVSDLDEAPGSYKDINLIIENQKDLVKVLVKLEPLGVIKG